MNNPIHIADVCKQLNTTSRTIRYYEEIGLIETQRDNKTAPRKLNDKNVERLKKILFLRKIGLSLDEITILINNDSETSNIIFNKRAEFMAEIANLKNRIRLLEEVMTVAENGGDIYAVQTKMPYSEKHNENCTKADALTTMLLERRFDELTAHFTKPMKERLPVNILTKVWDDTLQPCGEYIGKAYQINEGNIVINYLQFERLGVSVKFVFNDGMLSGLWFDYFKGD